MRVPAKLFIVAAMLATPAHAAVISIPTSGSWSYESFVQPGFTGISATGTNFANGFHFDARQCSQSPPLGVLYNQVQYITGTYNFAGFDTLNFTVQGQAGPGGIHIFWQLMSGSDVLTTGTDGGVINVNQLALPLTDPLVTLLLVSNHPVSGFSEFAVDLTAVPAPATLPLVATGLGMMGWFAWRRKIERRI
jgi:hypothetical protein